MGMAPAIPVLIAKAFAPDNGKCMADRRCNRGLPEIACQTAIAAVAPGAQNLRVRHSGVI